MSFEDKYVASESEAKIREFWDKEEVYKFDEKSKKVIYSIDTPPPTLSGKMHIGHAFSYTQTDFIARFKRMSGFEVFYPFGTDDNGLATEKLVQKEKKVNLRKVGREEAIKICNEYLDESRPEFIQDWKNLGISCDFSRAYSTLDDDSRRISQKSFIDLFKKGIISQKEGPVPWDRVFQTAIAQAELEDLERTAFLNYVKAKIVGTENTFMIYATTRPELCFAVGGLSVEDSGEYVKLRVGNEYWITGAATYIEKFADFEYEVVEKLIGQDLIGDKVIIPFVDDREIEISHDVAVKADFGTGIAYFCSYGGTEDIEWFARHKINPFNVIGKDGRLSSLGKKYEGMLAEEARKKIIVDLECTGFIIMKEKKTQIVNVGERSGAEVEYIVSKQWYVNYLDKKEHFWEMAEKFNWSPDFMKKRLESWIKGLNWDWGFSRQRYFGIPIPVWFDKNGKVVLPDESQLPVDPMVDRPLGVKDDEEFTPEQDVLDTWFTSASTPFLAIGKVKDESIRDKLFPMDLRPQAHDIINFWLFYTMAKTNLMYECNPFKDVNVSGFVLAPDGTKMSKSKGNGVVPQDVVEKFSNDALRFAAGSTKLGQDIPFQEKEVKTGLKVANKIFNANKFAAMLLENFSADDKEFEVSELNSIDKWILAKLQKVIFSATKNFESYDYSFAKADFEQFFMRDVADNYIEIVKQRLWKPDEVGADETKKAQKALYTVLLSSLKGLAPFMPFITEEVYQNFYTQFEDEKCIHRSSWPEVNESFISDEICEFGDRFVEVVGEVRKYKADKQLSMKAELECIKISCSDDLKEFIEGSIGDLKSVTSAKNVEFAQGEFSVKIK